MNCRSPPRSALWLLERLGGTPRLDPLIGDLQEQFAVGRSRLWYWRQVVGTLAVDLERTLRVHGASFFGAVIAGCTLIWLWDVGGSYAFHALYANLPALSRHPWTAAALMRVAGLQLHGFLGDGLLLSTVWAVTRIHRAHPRAVLVVLVLAVSAPYLSALAPLATRSAAHSPSTAQWVSRFMLVVMQAVCILAAGLWIIRGLPFHKLSRLTRSVAVLAGSMAVLVGLAQSARLVGELSYTLQAGHALFAVDIASIAFLALLLWRSSADLRMPDGPPTPADSGPRT